MKAINTKKSLRFLVFINKKSKYSLDFGSWYNSRQIAKKLAREQKIKLISSSDKCRA